ncbi:hypothetical protein CI109_100949 [Kwoniella shandongensis]|uniref:Uncharacterized protein n=1 Tax=Kwoniella shandongensis TaxID=1734106 RepID=A0A5M6C8D4_9TREE|nr:uncharacterized protein CI109_001415 [Kwoniella shandongensis]KAA5530012.1 hypothetical protein CI109_001415 [Kwoniella shandongensis]
MAPFSPLPTISHSRTLRTPQPFPHLFGQTLPHHSPKLFGASGLYQSKLRPDHRFFSAPTSGSHHHPRHQSGSCLPSTSSARASTLSLRGLGEAVLNGDTQGISYGIFMCLFIATLWLIAAFSASQMSSSLALSPLETGMTGTNLGFGMEMEMEMGMGMVELDGWELRSWRRSRISDETPGNVVEEEGRKKRNEVVLDVLSRIRKEHLEAMQEKQVENLSPEMTGISGPTDGDSDQLETEPQDVNTAGLPAQTTDTQNTGSEDVLNDTMGGSLVGSSIEGKPQAENIRELEKRRRHHQEDEDEQDMEVGGL